MYPKRQSPNWVALRIGLVAAVFALGTLLLIVRGYRLQVSDAEMLQKRAEKQRTRVLHLESRRGMILDRSGEQVAASLEVKSIYARPRQITDKSGAARVLAKALEMDEHEVLSKMKDTKPFVWIRRRVSPVMADKVKEAALKGVFSATEFRRFYPLKGLAAHAIGFAGIDSKGLEGLELHYDRDLKADPVPVTAQRDALGRPVMFAAMVQGPKRHDLHLTLDKNIQYIAERELEEAVLTHRARSGIVVVMDADSGEILGLAVRPSYNLNVFHKATADVRRNRAVADTFEPGSTFKVFLGAAALDLGVAARSDRFFCHKGRFRYQGSEIHDIVPRGWLTFDDILVYSSNIGAVQISEKLTKSQFYRSLKGFGFGSETGVDLPGERSGLLSPPGRWSVLTKANIAFGQGITVNALQLTAAFGAAVNGGILYRPHLMKRITNALGETIREYGPAEVRRVIKPSTSAQLLEILRNVVTEGTGKAASIEGVRVIGKTGTAQKADPAGGYSNEKYVASFIGALVDVEPRLVILVMINEPSGKHKTGGKVSAPVFRSIGEGVLSLCGSRSPEADLIRAESERRLKKASRKRIGRVKVRKAKEPGQWILPDLSGMSMRQALDVCGKIKCDAMFQGSGVAVKQLPGAGEVFTEGAELRVIFEEQTS